MVFLLELIRFGCLILSPGLQTDEVGKVGGAAGCPVGSPWKPFPGTPLSMCTHTGASLGAGRESKKAREETEPGEAIKAFRYFPF